MIGMRNNSGGWSSRLGGWSIWRFTAMSFLAAGIGLLVILLWGGTPALAQEAISQEEPTPSSVDEIVTPMDRSFEEKKPRPGLFPWLKEQLKDTPAFFRDTKLDLNARTYYFDRNKNDSRMTPNTFVGYTFTGSSGGKEGAPGFRYGIGYIDKIKPRNSDTFISMSEAAGVRNADRGVFTGGGNVS